MLQQAADRIDKQIYEDKNPDRADNSCLLSNLGNNWKTWMQKQKEIAFLEGCVAYGEAESSSQTWMEQLEKAQEELEAISHTPLTSRSGPVCSQFDAVLDKHAITPQSYHSRLFTGNHCNKYLHPEVFKDITASIVRTTCEWTSNPFIVDDANEIKLNFDLFNEAYALVHNDISHTYPIAPVSLLSIKTNIDSYMATYRRMFKKKVTQKQHILETHCLPFIQEHKIGLGLLGEQGGELIHSSIAKLEKRTAGIRQEERKIKTIMECHLLQVAPLLQLYIPQTKKRKVQN
ncbi:amine oxidase [Plakobranchus ocellatus]|uniref:Amine oxidase n=1 Tax=Plakobranchus ocellatus TaxID=259542 RepID=A0AAV3Z7T4_9GAST|nr:amine oxidase [Plakobranchus ocellatus]